jgi:uncharacterized protein (TIGR00290 family)
MNSHTNLRYATLWSGGKDSCLALWRAKQLGLGVIGLVNFFDEFTDRVRFHAVRSALIRDQASALGLGMFQYATRPDSYSAAFSNALAELKTSGYEGIIAGDIHLQDVRQWNEEQVQSANLLLVEPLWHSNGVEMLEEFVAAGFRSVLTCCDDRWSSVLWPGREINKEFISDVSRIPGLDVSGEQGEYHSFVYDGPLFSRRIDWAPGTIRRANGFSQIDLVNEVMIGA